MQIRVRFAETDQMGVAHHAAWLVYLEAARIEWLRDRGLSYRDLEASGVSLAVGQVSITYRSAARFDDLLNVEVTLAERRSRSLRFDYRVEVTGGGGRPAAEASTLLIPTDHAGRAVRLPDAWSMRLAAASP